MTIYLRLTLVTPSMYADNNSAFLKIKKALGQNQITTSAISKVHIFSYTIIILRI